VAARGLKSIKLPTVLNTQF